SPSRLETRPPRLAGGLRFVFAVGAPTTKAAIAGLKPIVAAFYAAEGENCLRPEMVWWPPAFDSAVDKRLGPRRSSMVLAPEELALLFHLPLTEVPMEAAGIRVMPRHR